MRRTSLENTDIEENIKSIKAIPTKILKNSEFSKLAPSLETAEKNINEMMNIINIICKRILNLYESAICISFLRKAKNLGKKLLMICNSQND